MLCHVIYCNKYFENGSIIMLLLYCILFHSERDRVKSRVKRTASTEEIIVPIRPETDDYEYLPQSGFCDPS